MTFDEFVRFRHVKIRDPSHEKIVRQFFPYLESVTGNARLLPDLIGRLIGVDLSVATVPTWCFGGNSDEIEPPYPDVDFYVRLTNGIRVYVYGSVRDGIERTPGENGYVVYVVRDCLSGKIDRRDRHVFLN